MKEQKYLDLLGIIEKLEPEYRQLWIDICNMETRSDKIDALNKQTDFLIAFAKNHGMKVQRISYPESGQSSVMNAEDQNLNLPLRSGDGLIIILPGEKDLAPEAILAHMDTVHEDGVFGYPPVTIDGDVIKGPGVIDCKGGLVCAIMAMDAIRLSGLSHREMRLILNPDEESGEHIGMQCRKDLFAEGSKGCIAAFNTETGNDGRMTIGRKGVVRIAIDITGVKAHAGNAYFAGASAIREAAYKTIEIEKHSVEGGMTFNVGLVSGGTVVNIVPDECHMELDIRILRKEQQKEAEEIIDEIVSHAYVEGTSAKWSLLHVLPPMEETPENHKLFDHIARLAHDYELEELVPVFKGGGSDSAFTVLEGIPTVCSMGACGQKEHTEYEWGKLSSLKRRAGILALSLVTL